MAQYVLFVTVPEPVDALLPALLSRVAIVQYIEIYHPFTISLWAPSTSKNLNEPPHCSKEPC